MLTIKGNLSTFIFNADRLNNIRLSRMILNISRETFISKALDGILTIIEEAKR